MVLDDNAKYYDQKPIEEVVQCKGSEHGHYMKMQGFSQAVHTDSGNKVILWPLDIEDSVYSDWQFHVSWDENMKIDERLLAEKEQEEIRHKALKWEEEQWHIKTRSYLRTWFPLEKYGNAENPYKEHLPKDWE